MSNTPSTSLPNSQNITRVVLNNGVTVLVYENHAAQSVVLTGSLRAGSHYEDTARQGLASIATSALMRGTENRDFDTINSALEDIGADLNISAGVHRTNFFGKSLAEDLPVLVDLLSEMLRGPTFPPVQVERLRGEIMTGLQIRQQDSRYRANRAFYENVYPPEHPYHRSTRGTLETVPLLQIEDMRDYHRRVFGPENMIVVIVGAVKAAEAIATVRACLEDWRNDTQPDAPSLPPVAPPSEIRRAFIPLAGKTQSDVVLGVAGPSRSAPDYHAAQLANSVLGQFGMMGRIGQKVREELGLAYYAGSSVDGGLGPGPWSVSAGVNPTNVDLAIERILDELRRIVSEPVSEDDLSDVQSYYTGHLPLQLESNEGIAGAILNIETFGLGLDYLLTYRSKIYSLNTDDLLRAARHYLHPDALVISIAGPDQAPTGD